MSYDPSVAASFYDAYGDREWTRFDDGRTPPASLATHLHYLGRFVRAGDRVLDIGCGPGRFTLELARLGARTVAADLSPGQLELHRAHVPDDAVEARVVADVVDLSQFGDRSFDAAVCYGGPLSYVMEDAPRAVAELVRVTKPGGHVLVSVMSLVGPTLSAAGGIGELVRAFGEETVRQVTTTGRLAAEVGEHGLVMRLYRWSELRGLLEPHGRIVAASAAGMFPRDDAADGLLADLELDLGAEPGALDIGHHILAVLEVA
ncbi:MAG: class I SAM-dependent methyltransferase [Gaiellaceae bacterium]